MASRDRLATALVLGLGLGLTSACDSGGFKLGESGSTQTLRAVFVTSRSDISLAGTAGTVLVYDHETSLAIDTSTDAGMKLMVPDYYGVSSSSIERVVAGDRGVVMSLRGTEWTRNRSNTQQRMYTMIRPAPSTIYAGGEAGRVIRKRFGQDDWERIDVNAPAGAKITSGWGISAQTVAFSTDRGAVIEQVAGQWVTQMVFSKTATTPLPLFGIWSSTKAADMFAVGLSGSIYKRAAGKTDWTSETSPVTQDLYALYGTAPDRIFAVGARGSILRYDGTAWTGIPSGTSNDLFAVHALDDGSLTVAVGSRGTIVILENDE